MKPQEINIEWYQAERLHYLLEKLFEIEKERKWDYTHMGCADVRIHSMPNLEKNYQEITIQVIEPYKPSSEVSK